MLLYAKQYSPYSLFILFYFCFVTNWLYVFSPSSVGNTKLHKLRSDGLVCTSYITAFVTCSFQHRFNMIKQHNNIVMQWCFTIYINSDIMLTMLAYMRWANLCVCCLRLPLSIFWAHIYAIISLRFVTRVSPSIFLHFC